MLSRQLYIRINKEYQDEYQNTFNIDPNDRNIEYLSLEENTKKYGRNLLFWYIRKATNDDLKNAIENPNEISSKIIIARDMICSSAIEKLINRIKEKELTNDIMEYLNIPNLKILFIKKPDINFIKQIKDKYDL